MEVKGGKCKRVDCCALYGSHPNRDGYCIKRSPIRSGCSLVVRSMFKHMTRSIPSSSTGSRMVLQCGECTHTFETMAKFEWQIDTGSRGNYESCKSPSWTCSSMLTFLLIVLSRGEVCDNIVSANKVVILKVNIGVLAAKASA